MKFLLTLAMLMACPTLSFAQMTLPSVFPDMKSINPAVISLRKSGIVRVSGAQDKIERKQTIEKLNATAFKAEDTSDITITNLNIFKGGKGGGTTSEWLIDYTTGEQKTEFTTDTESSDYAIESKAYYGKYAWGFQSRWGLELHYLSYTTNYSYEVEVNGQEEKNDVKIDITMPGVRIGKIFGSPGFSVGFIAEANMVKNSFKTSDSDVTGNDGAKLMPIVGLGIGSGGPNGLLEASVEVNAGPQDKEPGGKKPAMPMKASFIAEGKISGIILGYKGMYYKGQYMDFDKMVPMQLVYKNLGDEGRLEHVINFALKPEKGFSIGGSASVSNTTTQEKSSIYASENKHDTTTKAVGFGVRVGYVY